MTAAIAPGEPPLGGDEPDDVPGVARGLLIRLMEVASEDEGASSWVPEIEHEMYERALRNADDTARQILLVARMAGGWPAYDAAKGEVLVLSWDLWSRRHGHWAARQAEG